MNKKFLQRNAHAKEIGAIVDNSGSYCPDFTNLAWHSQLSDSGSIVKQGLVLFSTI